MTMTPSDLKEVVRSAYADTVSGRSSREASCCGAIEPSPCFAEDYSTLEGHLSEADYGLGCGTPTNYAALRAGEVVLDLGSGAGIDVFVAAREVGDGGRVIGIDFTPEMIDKARSNAESIGASNVEFRLGDIEDMPIDDASVDVIISNCVLNLVPNKGRAFAEMYRVLKPGGRFAVSDIVSEDTLPASVRDSASLYARCVAGATVREDYLGLMGDAGFEDVRTEAEKRYQLPESTHGEGNGVLASITVTGRRPT